MVKLCVVFSGLSHDLAPTAYANQVAFDYEHALMLLLNAADVQMEVQGIFLLDKNSHFSLDESLIKKFKQLDLFEVPCAVCTVNDESSDDGAVLLRKLPFINAITYQEFTNIVSHSEQVIWL